MFKELVDAIRDGVDGKEIEIGGESFTTKPVYRVPAVKIADQLGVNTLRGLIDYVVQSIDDDTRGKIFAHIYSESRVDICQHLDNSNRRGWLVTAEYKNQLFTFGHKYDQASFITLLQANFVDTADRTKLQKIVGGLTDESSLHLVDDGVSQKTTAKVGITTQERIETPNPFELAPYRTFPEIEQPVSEFILRLHRQADGVPLVSLHESDNAAWKLTAIKSIKAFLENDTAFKLEACPIIA